MDWINALKCMNNKPGRITERTDEGTANVLYRRKDDVLERNIDDQGWVEATCGFLHQLDRAIGTYEIYNPQVIVQVEPHEAMKFHHEDKKVRRTNQNRNAFEDAAWKNPKAMGRSHFLTDVQYEVELTTEEARKYKLDKHGE